ncbi:aspartyl/glutamyl-tRNA(Asn/Gln) amidotransferase subunit C [Microbacterium telephonicum]|uniref:Aspartyl/glutamyl-tRNA(Asn/Gln) amidotransferase subunit C n=1 Tax=Microbacterium telephonicum TaxID=1714841 RepID=A0A498C8P2_9MICO|nr:aspartyl/glutamyl-tRNA(Asn/Gln) amidotransferase subunit C [Microbacterium telephonicum]
MRVSEITPELVRHLGMLARIRLSDEEVDRLTGQLSVIVDNIAKVSEVVTPDVAATSHPIPLQNVFRADEVGTMLTVEQVLQNAPDAADSRFKVTAILGEEQ